MSDSKKPPLITDSDVIKQTIFSKLNRCIAPRGEVVFPCIPGMLDYYFQWISRLFYALDRPLPPVRQTELRQLLARKLQEGFACSSAAFLIFSYEPTSGAEPGLACQLQLSTPSIDEQYKTWIEVRKTNLFGSHPDAKVLAIASQLGQPHQVRVLDIGAGTGRNTLPLARLGYPVDAIELMSAFVEQLENAVTEEKLPVRVIQGDILDPLVRMRPASYHYAIATEVVTHFRDLDQVRLLLAKMCDFLYSGGILLFNTFLTKEDYQPEPLLREVAQLSWSSVITPQELRDAMEGLPLMEISNESVIEYEHQHLPSHAWPPTPWFETWATGRDVIPLEQGYPPMELRWILCRRL